ncbi:DoxX family membrane protein [Nocardiopsis sp. HUAS JQ3]|uniref:DoxX family protein n=1 Tax=Nocardiopsis sp. HUAS JQ3 TaxID=3061629 RepID=UPI0023A91D75|nr:DoxX family membrane protein [Nocardiopsis sp. HUAS JQ3]WDZ88757.1 DoxX family membrane protein [Nocardiopsis sp. HUAS JQ3]
MEPLIALVGVTALLLVLGAAGVRPLRSWPLALRGGIAAMFTLTGVSHFVGMREDMIAMVPPALPAPALLVTVTGVLELAGAAGVLWARTSPWAAAGLSALLVVVFPANVYAITAGTVAGTTESLPVRTAVQAVFLAATLAVLVHHLRARRRAAPDVPARAPRAGTAA